VLGLLIYALQRLCQKPYPCCTKDLRMRRRYRGGDTGLSQSRAWALRTHFVQIRAAQEAVSTLVHVGREWHTGCNQAGMTIGLSRVCGDSSAMP
jgi:hypothetical protein